MTYVAPLTAMTAAAMATTQLRVGCRVFCADYHNPVMLAKETATLDMLSEGRVEVGLGAGWVAAEYEGLGIEMERPGLRIERLAETNLVGADLAEIALDFAMMRGAQLDGASLVEARLLGAELTEVSLKGADLTEVDAQGAIFRGADLSRAKLTRANLRRATLHETKLDDAIFDRTMMPDGTTVP